MFPPGGEACGPTKARPYTNFDRRHTLVEGLLAAQKRAARLGGKAGRNVHRGRVQGKLKSNNEVFGRDVDCQCQTDQGNNETRQDGAWNERSAKVYQAHRDRLSARLMYFCPNHCLVS